MNPNEYCKSSRYLFLSGGHGLVSSATLTEAPCTSVRSPNISGSTLQTIGHSGFGNRSSRFFWNVGRWSWKGQKLWSCRCLTPEEVFFESCFFCCLVFLKMILNLKIWSFGMGFEGVPLKATLEEKRLHMVQVEMEKTPTPATSLKP